MSTTVDNRVVSMRFDNKQFESGVKTSMGTLGRFKKSLAFDKEQASMDALQKKADSFNLFSLSKNVDYIAGKFTVFGQLSQRVFDGIVDSATAAGKKIVSALAIDPVKTGFSEYETQINAVQTIMSNTRKEGTTLTEVSAALDELNTYADKTIYNFTEMTRNIGTFTAAGVDLKTSTSAIKGIANLAAVSGSNAQQASTAMYQLSQAMASGTVKLMDWNSVVNAGMGGQVFQDALIETARVHDVNVKKMIERDGSFRETLQTGWLTTEVLTETLAKFTGDLTESQLKSMGYTEKEIQNIIALGTDANNAATKVKTLTQLWDTLQEAAQSGWTSTWELIVGDFYQAQELFTMISDSVGAAIGAMSDARNNALIGGLTSGWEQFTSKGIVSVNDFKDEIIKMTRDEKVPIDDMIKQYGSFEKSLKAGWLSAEKMTGAMDNLIARYSKMSDKELAANGYTREQVDAMIKLRAAIDDGSVSIDEFVTKIGRVSGQEYIFKSIENVIKAVSSVVKPLGEAFHEVFGSLNPDSIYSFTESVYRFTESLILNEEEMLELKNAVKPVLIVVDNLLTLVKAGLKIGAHIIKTVAPLAGVVLQIAGHIGALTASMSDFASFEEFVTFATDGVIKAIDTLAGGVKYASNLIVEGIKSLTGVDISNFEEVQAVFDGLSETIKSFVDRIISHFPGATSMVDAIRIAFDQLRDIAENGMGAANAQMQKFFDFTVKMKQGASAFAKQLRQYLAPVVGEIKEMFSGVTITDIIGSGVLVGIFKAVKKFTAKASDISDSIADVLGKAGDSLEAFTKQLNSQTLKNVAISVAVLAGALMLLSRVNTENLAGAFAALSGTLIEVVGVLALLSKLKFDKDMIKIASVMILISMSVSVLAGALAKCSAFQDWDSTWPALVALVSIVAGLVTVITLLSKADPQNQVGKQMVKMSLSMILFGLAIGKLAKAVQKFGEINPVHLIKSLITVAVVLTEIGHFAKKLDGADLKSTKAAIVETALALIVLFGALYLIGNMDDVVLAKGMLSVGAALVGFVTTLSLLKNIKGDLNGIAKSIMGFAVAMNLLILPIYMLGKMNLLTLAQGMIAVGLALAGLTGALVAIKTSKGDLKGLAMSVISFAVALNLLAIPITILGLLPFGAVVTGLVALGGAIALLAASAFILEPLSKGLAAVAKSVLLFGLAAAGIGVGILGIATALGILATIGAGAIAAILASFAALLAGIKVLIPLIQDTLTAIGLMLIEMIKDLGGPLIEAAIILIDDLLIALDEHAPSLIEHLIGVVSGILEGLVAAAPRFAKIFVKLINTIFDAVSNSGAVSIPALMTSIFAMVGAVKLVASIGKDMKNALKGAGALVVVMSAVGLILGALTYFPADKMLTVSSALTPVMLSLSMAVYILSMMPVAGAIKAIESMGIVVAGITAVLIALGAINQIPGVSWLITEGGDLLAKIGEAIHKFISSLFGGEKKPEHSMFDKLPAAGENLSRFMSNCVPFIDGLKGIGKDVAEGAKNLGEAVLYITGSSMLSSLITFGSMEKKLTKFARGLSRMAPDLKSFYSQMEGLNMASMRTTSVALKNLGEMASYIPKSGGLAKLVTGDASISKFAKELALAAPSFRSYAMQMEGISVEGMNTSTNAIMSVVKMASEIPNTGGLASLVTGDNDIGAFGEALASFAPNFKIYADNMKDINPEVVNASTSMVNSLSEMAKLAPNSGGLAALVFGDNDLASFGSSLASFGSSFAGFYQAIAGIQPKTMSAVLKEINKLIKTVKDITEADIEHMGSFATNLRKMANDGLDDFLMVFKDSYERAKKAMGVFVTNLNSALEHSTVMEDAKNWGIRIAEGVLEGFTSKREALNEMAAVTSQAMADIINANLSINPVITPTVDMSDVYAKKRTIDSLFGGSGMFNMNIGTSATIAAGINVGGKGGNAVGKQTATVSGTTVTFNQYNNSPKALSQNDIYRNTKNQLAMAKKGVYG